MTEMLTWLAESGERLTVVGLLLILLFVLFYGVQEKQRWWVPGWMLTDCEAEKQKIDDKLDAYVRRTEERLSRFEDLSGQTRQMIASREEERR